jgi:hypothetical protein
VVRIGTDTRLVIDPDHGYGRECPRRRDIRLAGTGKGKPFYDTDVAHDDKRAMIGFLKTL